MRNTVVATLTCLTMLLSIQPGIAQMDEEPGGEQPGMGHQRGGQRGGQRGTKGGGGMQQALIKRIIEDPEIAAEVGLTEDQINTLKEFMYETQTKLIDLRGELEKAGMEQGRLLGEDPVDKKAVMKAVEETGKITTEIAKLQIEQLLLVKETLTAEQMAKIKTMIQDRMKERREEMQNRRDRRGRRGRGGDAEGGEAPKNE